MPTRPRLSSSSQVTSSALSLPAASSVPTSTGTAPVVSQQQQQQHPVVRRSSRRSTGVDLLATAGGAQREVPSKEVPNTPPPPQSSSAFFSHHPHPSLSHSVASSTSSRLDMRAAGTGRSSTIISPSGSETPGTSVNMGDSAEEGHEVLDKGGRSGQLKRRRTSPLSYDLTAISQPASHPNSGTESPRISLRSSGRRSTASRPTPSYIEISDDDEEEGENGGGDSLSEAFKLPLLRLPPRSVKREAAALSTTSRSKPIQQPNFSIDLPSRASRTPSRAKPVLEAETDSEDDEYAQLASRIAAQDARLQRNDFVSAAEALSTSSTRNGKAKARPIPITTPTQRADKGKGKAKLVEPSLMDDPTNYDLESDDEPLRQQITRSKAGASEAGGFFKELDEVSEHEEEDEESDLSDFEPAPKRQRRTAPRAGRARRGAKVEESDSESLYEDSLTEEEDDDEDTEIDHHVYSAAAMNLALAASRSESGPSTAKGSMQEDRQWETEKQRKKRLKKEAREARIEANDKKKNRKRAAKLSHYQKTKLALDTSHPELRDIWSKLGAVPPIKPEKAEQPAGLNIKMLPFQLEGLHWMMKQEASEWRGGLLADEMGMGKTIQMIGLLLSDRTNQGPTLVLAPTVAIMQWRNEIEKFTTNIKVVLWYGSSRSSDVKTIQQSDVILTSYAVAESAFRRQEAGFRRKGDLIKEQSAIHGVKWRRVILDEAHNIKERSTNTAKAAFALQSTYRWCLSGTPLQNRVGELYSMIRFLGGDPYAYYYCKQCPCKSLHWKFSNNRNCDKCGHTPMQHTCFWNNEVLKPIQRFGMEHGDGKDAFARLRILLERLMLRRTKIERADDMGLPPRTIEVRRDHFNEEEEDLYQSLYMNIERKFTTYLEQKTVLNNYSNIFTLLTRMRQMANHPDLVLRSNTGRKNNLLGIEGGTSDVHVCRLCADEAEDAIMSKCRHVFCRECVRTYMDEEEALGKSADCPYCHALLSINLEDEALPDPRSSDGSRQGMLSRLDMNKWRSSTKIEALVEELTQLRTDDKTIKSIVFSQFVNFLDLIAFRLHRAGFKICRLEGNMSPEARDRTIKYFMENSDVTVFLVSLKAGGVALNLTEASRVYLMDPWWNPSVEVQAMDRIHRLGQHRPIIVKRMIIENSIESRIIELQNKKSAMIEAAIGKDDSAMGRLSVADLRFLFTL